VQHERAPRNCTPLAATVNGLSAHGDYYAARTSFALPQTNLFFPLPLHITAATASGIPFAPLTDPGRFLSPYAAQSLAAAAASSPSFEQHFPARTTTTPTAFQPAGTGLPPGSGLIQVPTPLPATTTATTTVVGSKLGLASEQVGTVTITESMFNSITGDSLALPAPPPIHSISSILSLSSAKENEVSSTGEDSPPRSGAGQQQQQAYHHHQLLFSPAASAGPFLVGGKSETDMLLESAAKLLFLAVKWAKTVPSFLQLPANDQKLLLEEAWAELFVITAAQWGLPIDNEFIVRNPQAVKLQSAIQQFGVARVDYREAACLKALVLFRPDQPRLYAAHEVLLLQDQTVALLHEKCGGVRLGHLLLLLPAIKAAANAKVLQEMLFRKTVGEVAIERLLIDLMKT
uniref:NR LBD domain-containing protein n=1 Tax=Anopheles maculatus TaxID=74869 RepID=A0A182SGP9_9DIPT